MASCCTLYTFLPRPIQTIPSVCNTCLLQSHIASPCIIQFSVQIAYISEAFILTTFYKTVHTLTSQTPLPITLHLLKKITPNEISNQNPFYSDTTAKIGERTEAKSRCSALLKQRVRRAFKSWDGQIKRPSVSANWLSPQKCTSYLCDRSCFYNSEQGTCPS